MNSTHHDVLQAWGLRTKRIEEEARREAEERLAESRRHQAYLRHQMDLRARQATAARQERDEVACMLADGLVDDERRFGEYAEACVKEWERRKKRTEPMELYLTRSANAGLDPAV
eukprot:evm.model.scf_345.5 EVM.evm.TU.scf_345.5   scf_345:64020-64364(+)